MWFNNSGNSNTPNSTSGNCQMANNNNNSSSSNSNQEQVRSQASPNTESSGNSSGASSSNNSNETTGSGRANVVVAQADLNPVAGDTNNKSKQNIAPTSNTIGQSNYPTYGGPTSKQASSDVPSKISFHLKTSIFTRRVTLDSDKMALGLIKQLAIAFLNELYFQVGYPANTYIGDYIQKHFSTSESLQSLYDRLVLRKYCCQQESFLPFNSVGDIEPESYISIEVSEKHSPPTSHLLSANTSSAGHALNAASATASAFNSSSSNYHHHQTPSKNPSSSGGSSSSGSSYHHQRPATSQVKMSHDFKSESYLFMNHCASCTNLIGAFRQGYQCATCKRTFCPKCKVKAEMSGDSCVVAATATTASATAPSTASSSAGAAAHQPSPAHATNQSVVNQSTPPSTTDKQQQSLAPLTAQTGKGASPEVSPSNGSGGLSATAAKADATHSNMSKRKSASNLLHFNIANPFKSHHAQQQPPPQASGATSGPKEERSKFRGSAGALDPVLQQLGKLREQSQAHATQPSEAAAAASQQVQVNQSQQAPTNNLAVVGHNTQISSSHQNLFTDRDGFTVPSLTTAQASPTNAGSSKGTDEVSAGSLSVHQSPINSSNSRGHVNQLSNSARTSASDLHATSPTTNKTRDHLFISMDWIQISGEPLCGVCNKILKNHSQSLASNLPPVMCKNCKLQVHSHCQDLVLDDCLSRITESSRAAAERQESRSQSGAGGGGSNGDGSDKKGVSNTTSNVSRDNIRLRRLVPSVKHVKRPDSTKPIIEGWLKHTTLADEKSRQHYWRLDDTDITLYENDTSRRYFQAIALNKITRVMSSQSIPKRVKEDVLTPRCPELVAAATTGAEKQQQQTTRSANTSPLKSPQLKAQMNAIFAFELASGSMYLVQANSESEASKWLESLAAITALKKQMQQQETLQEGSVAPAAPPTAIGSSQDKSTKPEQGVDTVKKLVESVNDLCIVEKDGKTTDQVPDNQNMGQKAETTVQQANNHNINNKPAAAATVTPPPPATTKQVASPKQQPEKQVTAATPKQISGQRHQHHYQLGGGAGHRSQQNKSYSDPSRSRLYNRPRITIQINPMSIPDHWIVGKYLIERDRTKGYGFEELGSGQFGKVYAAISEIKAEDSIKGIWSGVPVAIKEISKARFDLRQQAKLKNEANILSQLDHPGVIILERVHDLSDKIYIVMEQLEDDMLEMIVSTDEKRLNERITKFLTYQILEALKYLHQKHIAHCDLKPENVLLVERRSQFPQIKLCDFGFAKIIEDNSFRSSLVGTPAYLAPEVVKGERYNRSVDLWSVGVIVYVSLSGEFPFNEGESIHDQISRANFMYPKNPWDGISTQAKNFINSLLRVNCEKRLSASRAQMDDWIQDYQLWCDLTELEARVGRRWVTDDADFQRWSKYAREHNLQLPRTAIQLHENLLAE